MIRLMIEDQGEISLAADVLIIAIRLPQFTVQVSCFSAVNGRHSA
jgi:hypothetical protein